MCSSSMERCFPPEFYLEFYFPPHRVEVLIQELENFSSCLYFVCNANACNRTRFFGVSWSAELSATVKNVKLNLTLWSENTLCFVPYCLQEIPDLEGLCDSSVMTSGEETVCKSSSKIVRKGHSCAPVSLYVIHCAKENRKKKK